MWLKHEQCEEVVREAWETGIHMGRENTVEHYLENCKIALTAWNSRFFGHVGKNIEHMQKKATITRSTSSGTFKPGSDKRDKNRVE